MASIVKWSHHELWTHEMQSTLQAHCRNLTVPWRLEGSSICSWWLRGSMGASEGEYWKDSSPESPASASVASAFTCQVKHSKNNSTGQNVKCPLPYFAADPVTSAIVAKLRMSNSGIWGMWMLWVVMIPSGRPGASYLEIPIRKVKRHVDK